MTETFLQVIDQFRPFHILLLVLWIRILPRFSAWCLLAGLLIIHWMHK